MVWHYEAVASQGPGVAHVQDQVLHSAVLVVGARMRLVVNVSTVLL